MILLKEVPLMTDSTGKNASMNADDCPWTDEEIELKNISFIQAHR